MVQGCPEKPFLSTRLLLPICLTTFAITFFTIWLQTESSRGFRRYLKQWLRNELISIDRLSPPKIIDAIYILGGSQRSLEYKFETAADLYNSGVRKKVLILHHPGITEYSPSLRRNLTNDDTR